MALIRECGILFRGFTLVNSQYHDFGAKVKEKDLRSGLLTAIINFSDVAFSDHSLEYIEGKKKVLIFSHDKIFSQDSVGEPELLISYVICDKEKDVDKVRQRYIPRLKDLLSKFKEKYEKKNLSNVSKFTEFKKDIDNFFGEEGKSSDQKLKGVLF